jgi:hypothetical protein
MERILTCWTNNHKQPNTNLNFLIICEREISLFEDLKEKVGQERAAGIKDLEFEISQGWSEWFKNCAYLYSL